MRRNTPAIVGAMGLSLSLANAARAAPADPALSALLKGYTQALSTAGLNGDRAKLDKYLDADVIYTVEDGSLSTKADVLAGADGVAKPGQSLTVTDWALRVQGDVATATFIDELKQTVFGQPLDYKFRSTETWVKKPEGWKLISSHTMALLDDPKAVHLPAPILNDYVGHYRIADGGPEVDLAIKDGDLVAAPKGGAPVVWKAEARDVFFTPGQPRGRKVFQRDADGRITGYAVRREGRDVMVARDG